MKGVTLGIILPGDPDCQQKDSVFLNILEKICSYGAIVALIGIIFSLILLFTSGNGWFWGKMILKLFVVMVLLLLSSKLWEEKLRCEYCGHFFTMERLSGDRFLDSSSVSVSRTVYDSHNGVIFDSNGDASFYAGATSRTEHGEEVTKRYTYCVRCSCCGSVSKVTKERTHTQY